MTFAREVKRARPSPERLYRRGDRARFAEALAEDPLALVSLIEFGPIDLATDATLKIARSAWPILD